jgi:tight adherence protein B
MVKEHLGKSLIGLMIGYLLYKSLLLCIPVALLFFVYSLVNKNQFIERKKTVVSVAFRDFLICLEPLLKSSENFSSAYCKAVEDYEKIHGTDVLLLVLKSGAAQFRINNSAGDVLYHIAEKTDIEDAYLFAGSIESSEETGISVIDITNHTLGIITEKIQLKNELLMILSGKRFEHILVSIIPAAILVLLSVGAGSYLSPLYETTAGRGVMTVAGIIFCASWYAGKQITSIEV